MDPGRWEKIASLYEKASERDLNERGAFLAEASRGDDELRREVESLLRQEVSQDGVLERVAQAAGSLVTAAAPRLPGVIGSYRVLALVGEGGMGLVYEAEQDHPRRIVALKLLKTGLTGAEALWRFDRESMALGRLQHPGIARIYEAGTAETETGFQPYFAMEFIRGKSIVEDAQARSLTTRQRLENLAQVADAVQHAHQRGIIHRDLKPSNILVDENGQPKILDFGVALITDTDLDASRQTDLGELVGTLAYMSPEQVLGDPLEVDARSDIYSLGVVLYELLAEKLPYNVSRKVFEAARIIREETPVPLGRINRAFRGDLETIVAKALEKEKARRYSSAAELAMDIRRYLKMEPILARAPSLGYQLGKFAGRHKALVVTAALVLLMVAAGIVAVATQSIRANRAERAALIERDRATSAERRVAGERDRATEAEQRAAGQRDRAQRSEQIATEQRNHALEEKRRADTQAAIATAVNNFLQSDLLSQAGASAQSGIDRKPDPDLKVRTALDRAAAKIPGRFESQPEVEAALRQTMGAAYQDLGLYPDAQQQLEKALQLRQRVLGPANVDTLRSLDTEAQLAIEQGKYGQAEKLFNTLLAENRASARDPVLEIDADTGLAQVLSARGAYPQAAALLEKTLTSQTKSLGQQDPAVLAAMSELSTAYVNEGEFAKGAEEQTKVFETRRRTLGAEHPATLVSMDNLAYQYRQAGETAKAETLFVQALAIRRRVLGNAHPDTLLTMRNLGRLYYSQKDYAQAEPLQLEAYEGMRRVLGEEHQETLESMNNVAALYWKQGKLDQADALFTHALEIERRVLGPESPTVVSTLLSLGRLNLERHDYANAEPALREALTAQARSSRPWMLDYTRAMLGSSLAGERRFDEAEPLLISSHAAIAKAIETVPAENRSVLDKIRLWIVEMYQSWDKPEKVAEWQAAAAK